MVDVANFLKLKLAFLWGLFSSYSIFAPSLNLSHLIPHHGSCNTFGHSLWPFLSSTVADAPDWWMPWLRVHMCVIVELCIYEAVIWPHRADFEKMLLDWCILKNHSEVVLQVRGMKQWEVQNSFHQAQHLELCALCLPHVPAIHLHCVCVQDTWPLGDFTSKSWCANKDKRRSVTVTSWRFRSAGQFSAFDWAPGWTLSWFLFTVVVLVHLF